MRGIKEALEKAEMLSNGSIPTMPKEVSNTSVTEPKMANKTILWILFLQFLGVFILSIVFYGYIKHDARESLTSINNKLDQLGKKLDPLKDQLSGVENSIKAINQLSPRESSSVKVFTTPSSLPKNELSDSKTTVNQLAHQRSSSTAEIKTSPLLPPREMPQHSEQYHKVDRGETLYRISKRYGISVDKIRLLNNLKQDQAIQPGQKLLVAPAGH